MMGFDEEPDYDEGHGECRHEIESLRTKLASAEEELGAAKVNTETQRLALEVVAWYFDQRRYSVSPAQDGNYYLHDTAHRYSKLIKQSDGSWWPSVYMALCAGRAAMRGEGDGYDG